jgi:hypothetical protein
LARGFCAVFPPWRAFCALRVGCQPPRNARSQIRTQALQRLIVPLSGRHVQSRAQSGETATDVEVLKRMIRVAKPTVVCAARIRPVRRRGGGSGGDAGAAGRGGAVARLDAELAGAGAVARVAAGATGTAMKRQTICRPTSPSPRAPGLAAPARARAAPDWGMANGCSLSAGAGAEARTRPQGRVAC